VTDGGSIEVTVAAATCRRPDDVRRLLDALEAQTLAPERFEVVLCDDGADPASWASLRERAGASPLDVRLLRHETNRGAAAARNTAWRAARAPLVAFTDDDCEPAPGWLDGLLAASRDADMVQGSVGPRPELEHLTEGPFARTIRVDDARFFETCNVLYRVEDLEAAGGFSEAFGRGGGEDTELALRVLAMGRRTAFAPDAHVFHAVRPSSFRLAFRDVRRWVTIPLVVRLHPVTRRRFLHRRIFWKRSHLSTCVALAGLGLVAGRRPAGAALVVPWVWLRLVRLPLTPHRAERVRSLPGAFAIDAAEVAVMVAGSARHRTVVL
jgi:GT2 family glycosyltransferase